MITQYESVRSQHITSISDGQSIPLTCVPSDVHNQLALILCLVVAELTAEGSFIGVSPNVFPDGGWVPGCVGARLVWARIRSRRVGSVRLFVTGQFIASTKPASTLAAAVWAFT